MSICICFILYIVYLPIRRKTLAFSKEFDFKYFEDTHFEKRVWVPSAKVSNYLMMFTKNYIGEDNEMGQRSLKDIIITLSENETVPRVIAFWNSSVSMCIKDSELLIPLNKLEKAGVKILVAGHALDELNIKSSLRVGNLANHFDLVAVINKVQKVVTF